MFGGGSGGTVGIPGISTFSGMATTMAAVARHIGVSAVLMGDWEAVIQMLTEARVVMLQQQCRLPWKRQERSATR
jgi:hypothetical protein